MASGRNEAKRCYVIGAHRGVRGVLLDRLGLLNLYELRDVTVTQLLDLAPDCC